MFSIRAEQLNQLGAVHQERLIDKLCARSRGHFGPGAEAHFTDASLRNAVIAVIQRARGARLSKPRSLEAYLDVTLRWGHQFETDARCPWARRILEAEAPEQQRAWQLATAAHHSPLPGMTDPGALDSALSKLSASQRRRDGRAEPWTPDRRSKLCRYLEQLLLELPAASVANVTGQAEASARAWHAAPSAQQVAAFALLTIVFGVGFQSDPFLPSVAERLRSGVDAGEVLPELLEVSRARVARRSPTGQQEALIWL